MGRNSPVQANSGFQGFYFSARRQNIITSMENLFEVVFGSSREGAIYNIHISGYYVVQGTNLPIDRISLVRFTDTHYISIQAYYIGQSILSYEDSSTAEIPSYEMKVIL